MAVNLESSPIKMTRKNILVYLLALFMLVGWANVAFTPVSDDDSDMEEVATETVEEEEVEEGGIDTVEYDNLAVHFIDVGQGDCTFIVFPDGQTMLIDAGSAEYSSDVVEYIESLGYSKIDYVVATHPHEDHIGGLVEVIEAFEVDELWAPDAQTDTDVYMEFLDAVETAGLQINTASAGEEIISVTDSEYTVTILSPEENVESDDLNDYSVVILVEYGETSFLLTSDASIGILENCVEGEVDVLKVSHHGSATGTDESLAKVLSPTISVISYEEGNSYGHPDQEVIDALEAVGSGIYGTGVHGTIVVYSDGAELTVEQESYGTVQAGEIEEEASEEEVETTEEITAAATSTSEGSSTTVDDDSDGTDSSSSSGNGSSNISGSSDSSSSNGDVSSGDSNSTDSSSSSNSSSSDSSDSSENSSSTSNSSSSSSSGNDSSSASSESSSTNSSSSSGSSSSDASESDSTTYVYIATASGTKYHKSESCRGLSNSTSTKKVTLEYALSQGYEACKICY